MAERLETVNAWQPGLLDWLRNLPSEWKQSYFEPPAVPLSSDPTGKTPEQRYSGDPIYTTMAAADLAGLWPGAAPAKAVISALARLPRSAQLAALAGLGMGASATEAEAGPKMPSMKQMRAMLERFGIEDAQRILNPGVYKRPDVIAKEAAAFTAPEHPAMKQLFGVNRDELWEIGGRGARQGNKEPPLWMPGREVGSSAAEAIMTPQNAQRQIDVLTEAKKYPELFKGMESWYVMDPAFDRMKQLVGREQAIKDYTRFNATMTPFSSNSDVLKEINRGTAARMMADLGPEQWQQFVKYGGMPVEKRPKDFPSIMRDVIPHLRHSMHVDPVERWLATGAHGFAPNTVKNVTYSLASGVPETGFQTRWAVPDAHIARSSGMADVRLNEQPGKHMAGAEYRSWAPWYRESVAKPMGIEAVPAQGLQWGAFAPQTGVKTPVGAPKLELMSQLIWEKAKQKGLDPYKLRDDVLMGKEHALWLLGIPTAGGAAYEAYQPRQ